MVRLLTGRWGCPNSCVMPSGLRGARQLPRGRLGRECSPPPSAKHKQGRPSWGGLRALHSQPPPSAPLLGQSQRNSHRLLLWGPVLISPCHRRGRACFGGPHGAGAKQALLTECGQPLLGLVLLGEGEAHCLPRRNLQTSGSQGISTAWECSLNTDGCMPPQAFLMA